MTLSVVVSERLLATKRLSSLSEGSTEELLEYIQLLDPQKILTKQSLSNSGLDDQTCLNQTLHIIGNLKKSWAMKSGSTTNISHF